MDSSEWQIRVENKLDRLADAIAEGHADAKEARAMALAVKNDVDTLKVTSAGLKTTQDKQKGAVGLMVLLSIISTIVMGVVAWITLVKGV